MNVKLLRKTQEALLRQSIDPKIRRFDMSNWGGRNTEPDAPVCQTAACLAGEVVLQARAGKVKRGGGIELVGKFSRMSIPQAAQKVLRITKAQAERLFLFARWGDVGYEGHTNHWPDDLSNEYGEASHDIAPLVGAKRIELFIQSKGSK